ncbi:MAG TPA: peptidase S10 [Gammaproteobacteria bacterium]
MKKLALFLLLGLAAALPAFADEGGAKKDDAKEAPVPKEDKSVTHHSVSVGGKSIAYDATAGTLLIKNEKDEAVASMFYVAYTAGDGKRPVTFVFNGGPGSSSMWLHMGSFAPVRIVTPDAAFTAPAPYQLAPNAYSLLDKTDLVFVDAIGTGFSRIAGKGEGKDFYGVDQDVSAFGRFIQRYIGVNGRWNSPKFLLGESYGTTRAAGLSLWLENKGIALNGVVLVSSWLDPYVDFFGPVYAVDEPYELYLPTMAATAWYHKKVPGAPKDLAAFVQQARDFALGEYATALSKGDRLSPAERQAVAQKLAGFTGLSADFIMKARLRVTPDRFQKELLRDEARVTGRLDARFLGIDHDSAGESPENDAASSAFGPAIVAAFNNYVRTQLNYGQDLTYRPTSYEVGNDWDWGHSVDGNKAPLFDVAEDLRAAMSQDPHLLVFSANGYYDFATPFFETEYTLDHMGLDDSLRKNLRYGYYEAGHMMYMHEPALKQMKSDLAKFYDDATH